MEYSFGERHLLPMPTLAACLARIGRVDSHVSPASFFRFAGELTEKRRPRGICNTLGETVIMDHPVHAEVFHADDPKGVDDFAAFLMGEVLSFPRNAFMDTCNYFTVLSSLWGAFGKPGMLALHLCQRFFFLAEKAWISNFLSIGKRGKGLQSDINTCSIRVLRQALRFHFTREAGVPFAGAALADGTGFRRAFKVTMQDNLDFAHFGNEEFSIFERTPTRNLRKRQGVVPTLAAKSWVSWMFSSLTTPKKGFHGQIDTHSHVLQDLRMDIVKRWALLFQDRIGVDLLIAGQALPSLFIGIPTLFQQMVIQPSAFFKDCLQLFLLFFCWVDPMPKHFMHSPYYSINRTVVKQQSTPLPKPQERNGALIPCLKDRGLPRAG